MRRFLLLGFAVCLMAGESALLSSLKQKQIDLEYEKNKEDSSKVSTSWINPIIAKYTSQKNDYYSPEEKSQGFSLSLSQPVFKSGGIYYQIKQAGVSGKVLNLGTDIKRQGLISQALGNTLSIKKLDAEIKKQKLLVENAKIDLLRKTEQYEAGFLDAGFLDNAMLEKNRNELALFELEKNRDDTVLSLKNISDLGYEEIEVPQLQLVDVSEFLNTNLELDRAMYVSLQNRYQRNQVIASYLPQVNLEASYNDEKIVGGRLLGLPMNDNWNDYRTYGVTVSMPIDINSKNSIQSASIEYLKSAYEKEDKKREMGNLYKSVIVNLKTLDKKTNLAEEDVKSYASLVSMTQEGLHAGDKTEYDLQTLENAKNIRELDIKIYGLQKQIELLKLYEKMNDGTF